MRSVASTPLYKGRSIVFRVIQFFIDSKLDHMIHFSFQKSYGGSIFSFFEIGSGDKEDSENVPEQNEGEEE